MRWKRNLEAGDLVHFGCQDSEVGYLRAWGIVTEIQVANDVNLPRNRDGNVTVPPQEIDLTDRVVTVKSGSKTVTVPMDEIHERTKEEDWKLPDNKTVDEKLEQVTDIETMRERLNSR